MCEKFRQFIYLRTVKSVKVKITRRAVAHIRIRYMFFELICYPHFTDWELQVQYLDQNPIAGTNSRAGSSEPTLWVEVSGE